MIPYFHRQLGDEVTMMAWHYKVIEEGTIPSMAGTALYVLGGAVTGSACCGAGEIRFILVPGIIKDGHAPDESDIPEFSMVEPVKDVHIRIEIEKRLKIKYPMYQINFMS